MVVKVWTSGDCTAGYGKWVYHIEYDDLITQEPLKISDKGSSNGTTGRQMKLMAILRALDRIKSLDLDDKHVRLWSDCRWCVKCLTKEYDCVSDNRFKEDKVTRGYVQYLQEIWWKAEGLHVDYQVLEWKMAPNRRNGLGEDEDQNQ